MTHTLLQSFAARRTTCLQARNLEWQNQLSAKRRLNRRFAQLYLESAKFSFAKVQYVADRWSDSRKQTKPVSWMNDASGAGSLCPVSKLINSVLASAAADVSIRGSLAKVR